jgi:hypothetical protein
VSKLVFGRDRVEGAWEPEVRPECKPGDHLVDHGIHRCTVCLWLDPDYRGGIMSDRTPTTAAGRALLDHLALPWLPGSVGYEGMVEGIRPLILAIEAEGGDGASRRDSRPVRRPRGAGDVSDLRAQVEALPFVGATGEMGEHDRFVLMSDVLALIEARAPTTAGSRFTASHFDGDVCDCYLRGLIEGVQHVKARAEPDCCELACYEDPGCSCEGCAEPRDDSDSLDFDAVVAAGIARDYAALEEPTP